MRDRKLYSACVCVRFFNYYGGTSSVLTYRSTFAFLTLLLTLFQLFRSYCVFFFLYFVRKSLKLRENRQTLVVPFQFFATDIFVCSRVEMNSKLGQD